jgi:hypothetical protein
MHAYRKLAVTAALVMGVAAGSYGIASAASGSGSSTPSLSLSAAAPSLSAQAQQQQPSGRPWGQQRSDETLLTGDTKAKAEAVATAKLSGGTIVRTETDADGNAAYEVHMVQADGTPATVYVDKSFGVVKVETGMPGGHGGPPPAQQGASA